MKKINKWIHRIVLLIISYLITCYSYILFFVLVGRFSEVPWILTLIMVVLAPILIPGSVILPLALFLFNWIFTTDYSTASKYYGVPNLLRTGAELCFLWLLTYIVIYFVHKHIRTRRKSSVE